MLDLYTLLVNTRVHFIQKEIACALILCFKKQQATEELVVCLLSRAVVENHLWVSRPFHSVACQISCISDTYIKICNSMIIVTK